jgi:TRAP-type C4-dicarboxylate transport system permease small subunit
MQNESVVQKIFGAVKGGQELVASVLMILLPVLVCVQVVLRYVFEAPLMGIEELMLFPIIWLYMLGGANASMDRTHISCGILTLYIHKPLYIAIFHSLKAFISVVVSIWLTYWAYEYFLYSLSMWKESDLLYIPVFYGESAVFIGLVLMTAYSIVEFHDSLALFRNVDQGGNK